MPRLRAPRRTARPAGAGRLGRAWRTAAACAVMAAVVARPHRSYRSRGERRSAQVRRLPRRERWQGGNARPCWRCVGVPLEEAAYLGGPWRVVGRGEQLDADHQLVGAAQHPGLGPPRAGQWWLPAQPRTPVRLRWQAPARPRRGRHRGLRRTGGRYPPTAVRRAGACGRARCRRRASTGRAAWR